MMSAEPRMAVRNATIFVRRRCNWGVIPRLAEKIRKLEGIAVAQNPILLGWLIRHRGRKGEPHCSSLKGWKSVHFHQGNSNGVVHTTHDRGVVSRWQRSNDRRLAWLSRSMPAVLDRADLVAGDDPADYRSLPVIIRSN